MDDFLLPLLPAMTLIAGVALGRWRSAANASGQPELTVVLAVAILGPLITTAALRKLIPGFDRILVCVSGMLVSIGTTMHLLFAGIAGADQSFFVTMAHRHGMFVGIGFAALVGGAIFAHRVDTMRTFPVTYLAIALLLTVTTIVFGQSTNGARLWLQLGPIRFQPSEIARLLLALFVASYLFDRRHLVSAAWRVFRLDLPPVPYLIPLVGAVLSAVSVLVFQNDLGMAALMVLGAFATVAGVVRSRATIGAGAAFLAVAAMVSFAATPRVRDRVSGWVDPWRDAAGSGFQFVQADYGLAAGRVFGDGGSVLTETVPEIHTDFVFVGIANQFGWLGSIAVLALTGVLVCRCILAALGASDGFGAVLAFSFAALLGIQVILIAGGTLRVLPLTGLTFPLLSYGGTSMVATMFTLGIIGGLDSSSDWRGRDE